MLCEVEVHVRLRRQSHDNKKSGGEAKAMRRRSEGDAKLKQRFYQSHDIGGGKISALGDSLTTIKKRRRSEGNAEAERR